jgi:hypothetical protein
MSMYFTIQPPLGRYNSYLFASPTLMSCSAGTPGILLPESKNGGLMWAGNFYTQSWTRR